MNRVQNVLSNRVALPLGPVWLRYTLRESLATARTPFMDPRPTANRREWQSAAAARAAATAATAVAAAAAAGRRRRRRLHRRAKREHAARRSAATPPPPRSAMMWKISTSSGSSSDEAASDGGKIILETFLPIKNSTTIDQPGVRAQCQPPYLLKQIRLSAVAVDNEMRRSADHTCPQGGTMHSVSVSVHEASGVMPCLRMDGGVAGRATAFWLARNGKACTSGVRR